MTRVSTVSSLVIQILPSSRLVPALKSIPPEEAWAAAPPEFLVLATAPLPRLADDPRVDCDPGPKPEAVPRLAEDPRVLAD